MDVIFAARNGNCWTVHSASRRRPSMAALCGSGALRYQGNGQTDTTSHSVRVVFPHLPRSARATANGGQARGPKRLSSSKSQTRLTNASFSFGAVRLRLIRRGLVRRLERERLFMPYTLSQNMRGNKDQIAWSAWFCRLFSVCVIPRSLRGLRGPA